MAAGDADEELYAVVGERMCQARQSRKLSQEKLAKMIGLSRASIVNIEKGRQRAPVHIMARIAHALNVDLPSLIPTRDELAAIHAPVQLTADVVKYIEREASDDPITKRLLTSFVQKATTRIKEKDGEHT